MAQEVTVVLIDDLDGSEATETVRFGLDGKSYEIDLNKRNAASLRKALKTYVDKGRSVRAAAARGSGGARAGRDYDIDALRAWAKSNRVKVPQRGRIPAAVVEQYKAAGGK